MIEEKLLGAEEIDAIISYVTRKIIEDVRDLDRFAIVGIQGGGVELASRVRKKIEVFTGKAVRGGTIDITFYRDDLATRGVLPVIKETRINFNISNMTILLVDDVILTGRSTKAALETLMSFGRPAMIKLFCMVDRCRRELPIQPDYCGVKIAAEDVEDKVNLILDPEDSGRDVALLQKKER
jgi:pyrimidine operon attenuation protein/uracil phosphoribosyltransferase